MNGRIESEIEEFLDELKFESEWKPLEKVIKDFLEDRKGSFISEAKTIDRISKHILYKMCVNKGKLACNKAKSLIEDIRYNIVREDLVKLLRRIDKDFYKIAC